MSDAVLNLVVVYAADLEAARRFYAALGLNLKSEQHGKGPLHYATEMPGIVFEIYPLPRDAAAGKVRLGFRVAALESVLTAVPAIREDRLRAAGFPLGTLRRCGGL